MNALAGYAATADVVTLPPFRSAPRELRLLAESAVRAGWQISQTSGSHYRWTSPAGATVISAGTPGCHRAALNVRSLLRRHGLDL